MAREVMLEEAAEPFTHESTAKQSKLVIAIAR